MPFPAWPLPVRLLAGSGGLSEPYPAAARTAFEDGPDRLRRRSHTRIKKVPVQILIDDDSEYAVFEAFVEGALGDGTAAFTIDLPMPGRGWVNRRAQFEGGAFKVGRHGAGWLVAATLNVFPG